MLAYTEEMFEAEKSLAQAAAGNDAANKQHFAKVLEAMGTLPCAVCGTMIRFHHLEGWEHQEPGMDHDGRPDRAGFLWPGGLEPPGRSRSV